MTNETNNNEAIKFHGVLRPTVEELYHELFGKNPKIVIEPLPENATRENTPLELKVSLWRIEQYKKTKTRQPCLVMMMAT